MEATVAIEELLEIHSLSNVLAFAALRASMRAEDSERGPDSSERPTLVLVGEVLGWGR